MIFPSGCVQAYVPSETEELVGLSMAQKNNFGKEEFSHLPYDLIRSYQKSKILLLPLSLISLNNSVPLKFTK